jgi:hypothetical protein
MPQFIEFTTRKPEKSGRYFVKGKGGFMAVAEYDDEKEVFIFPDDVPENKISDTYLQWLDENIYSGKNIVYGGNIHATGDIRIGDG